MTLHIINRETGRKEKENVYGGKLVNWLYGTNTGSIFLQILCKAPLSKLYGYIQNSEYSAGKINPFIQDFDIPMEEFVTEPEPDKRPYRTFNDFFIRKFKQGKRNFTTQKSKMPAFAEARYLGFRRISTEKSYPVKGLYLTPEKIISDERWYPKFNGGPMLIARLCPVDYHRFHFPDTCKIIDTFRVSGNLHSVNPAALIRKPDIFSTNERQVTILKTENFGYLAYIEVGALCVGKIVQTHTHNHANRGDEKGYFLFGGSTVIVMGEKNTWVPSSDILNHTKNRVETYIKLGNEVGVKTAIKNESHNAE